MAEAAASSVLESLNGLLSDEFNMTIKDKDKDKEVFRQLASDVKCLKDFIQDRAKSGNDKSYRDVERDIRKVLFQLEDTIDVYLNKVSSIKKSRIKRLLSVEPPLAATLKSIREQEVRPIIEKLPTRVETAEAPSTSEEQRWTTKKNVVRLMRQDEVVGLEDDENVIIDRILDEKEVHHVISIIGMRGVGKTTLASKIYHNERIAYEFPLRMWIYISQEFSKKDMLTQIMKKFTRQDLSGMSDDELSQTVKECLRYEKFLLVLDDVRSHNDWGAIQNCLPMSNIMGKVLITTPVTSIGEEVGVSAHFMRYLDDEKSWKLLQLEVFGVVAHVPPHLESIGRYIARKCSGLPLALVIVGEVLRKSKDWENVAKYFNVSSNYDERLSNVIELSYRQLPDELRCCFLYMGVFPKDYEIPSWTLIRLWIAEGFVKPKEGMSLEETATQYLDDLIRQSLVMASKKNSMGKVKTCRVHALIHDFCVEKAREEELFQVTKVPGDGVPDIFKLENCRRLCVHSNINRVLQLSKFEKGRSFLYFNESFTEVNLSDKYALVDSFELLKVWDSKSLQFACFPERISKLSLLRYITLSVVDLTTLDVFSELWNLQTLVVHTTSRFIGMKTTIWSLMQLRHLKTNAAIVLHQKGKGEAGVNLQTLDGLAPESCTTDMCERACNLKALGIRGSLETLSKDSSLSKFISLEKLKLLNDWGPYEPESRNPYLPGNDFFPPNLKMLTLSNTFLPWKNMSTLAMLSSLEVLKLKHNAFTGISWMADVQFPNLEFLLISYADLFNWEASTSSFPKIRHLVLNNCENLIEIPLDLTKSLATLDINRVRKTVVDSAMEVAETKKHEQELEDGKSGFPLRLIIGPQVLS